MSQINIYASLRKSRGWNQSETARRLGVSRSYIHCIEAGKRKPGIGTVCRYAETFGVPVGRILNNKPGQPVEPTRAENVADPIFPEQVRKYVNDWIKGYYPKAMNTRVHGIYASGSLSLGVSLESTGSMGGKLKYGRIVLNVFHNGKYLDTMPSVRLAECQGAIHCATRDAKPAFQAVADAWNDCIRKEEDHV